MLALDPADRDSADAIATEDVQFSRKSNLVRTSSGSAVRKVNQYKLLKMIGKGAYGEVYLAHNTSTATTRTTPWTVAVKVLRRSMLKRQRVGRDGSALDSIAREIEVMKQIQHENCVMLYEVVDDPEHNELFLVMEYISGGELSDLCQESLIDEEMARVVVADVCCALFHLHELGIVHRDVKPSNILLLRPQRSSLAELAHSLTRSVTRFQNFSFSTFASNHSLAGSQASMRARALSRSICSLIKRSAHAAAARARAFARACARASGRRPPQRAEPELTAKLCDFGAAAICEAALDHEIGGRQLPVSGATGGTPAFFAPEMCSPGTYDGIKADVWALGVTLYNMLYGRVPFEEATTMLTMEAIKEGQVPWPASPELSAECKSLLSSLLAKEPTERPSVEEVLLHPWLAEHGSFGARIVVKRQTQHIPEPVATDTLRPCSNSIRAHASGPSSTRSHPRQSGRSGRCAPANVPLRSDTPALLQNVVPAPADGPYRGNQLAV